MLLQNRWARSDMYKSHGLLLLSCRTIDEIDHVRTRYLDTTPNPRRYFRVLWTKSPATIPCRHFQEIPVKGERVHHMRNFSEACHNSSLSSTIEWSCRIQTPRTMVVGRDAAQTPSRLRVFSSTPDATTWMQQTLNGEKPNSLERFWHNSETTVTRRKPMDEWYWWWTGSVWSHYWCHIKSCDRWAE